MTSQKTYKEMGRAVTRLTSYQALTIPPKNTGQGGVDFYCSESARLIIEWNAFVAAGDRYATQFDPLFQGLVVSRNNQCPAP